MRIERRDGKLFINFSKHKEPITPPHLMQLQFESYYELLQPDKDPDKRENKGLESVFRDLFPLVDRNGNNVITYDGYLLGIQKCAGCPEPGDKCLYNKCNHPQKNCHIVKLGNAYFRVEKDEEECRKLKETYEIPVRLKLTLIDQRSGEKREEIVTAFSLPLMTERGTFIINGTEKVVVSQLIRSPGAFYTYDAQRRVYEGKVSPAQGSWIEFELDTSKGYIYVKMDSRRRKMPVTWLLRMLGYDSNMILQLFDNNEYIKKTLEFSQEKFTSMEKEKPYREIRSEVYKEIFKKLRNESTNTAEDYLKGLFTNPKRYDLTEVGRYKIEKKFNFVSICEGRKVARDIKIGDKVVLKSGDYLEGEKLDVLKKLADEGYVDKIYVFNRREDKEVPVWVHRNEEIVFLGDWNRLCDDVLDEELAVDVYIEDADEIIPEGTRVNEDLLETLLEAGVPMIKVRGRTKTYKVKDLLTPELYKALKEGWEVIGKDSDKYRLNRAGYDRFLEEEEAVVISPEGEEYKISSDKLKNLREVVGAIYVQKGSRKKKVEDAVLKVLTMEELLRMYEDKVKDITVKPIREIRFTEYFDNILGFNENRVLVRRRILGRKVLQDVIVKGKVIVKKGEVVDDVVFHKLIASRVLWIKVEKGRTLTRDDIIDALRYLLYVTYDVGELDDIDHIGNRRIRRVGELIKNEIRKALLGKMERETVDQLATKDGNSISSFMNFGVVKNAIKEFFNTGQLCQFMDQTNILAELENKRRLSALGPGGLKRERATSEVRGVHPSHFGRICPIQTPEGQNAGLIASLTVYGRINKYGFIETPLRKVVNGKVTDEVVYMEAGEEDRYYVAPADTPVDENGMIIPEYVPVKVKTENRYEFIEVEREKVQYMGVSPTQMVSVGSSLIPFLEHDDANRALMGTNMQRQAVPLIKAEAPFVATGMEERVVVDAMDSLVSPVDGEVIYADSLRIVIKGEDGKEYDLELRKFKRTNSNSVFNMKPIVKMGDKVKQGQVIADGEVSDKGRLSVGKNVLVFFMPYDGYNFEDAIVASRELNERDIYTSIHMKEHEVEAREGTGNEGEEITADIPDLSEEQRRKLDERGVARIGIELKKGDVLVGKVEPKPETETTSLDKLLKAIFNRKKDNKKNVSYKLKNGEEGKVVKVEYLDGNEYHFKTNIKTLVRVFLVQRHKLMEGDKMAGRHGNKGVISILAPREDLPMLDDGTTAQLVLSPLGVPSRMNVGQIYETILGWTAKHLGFYAITPIFESPKEDTIKKLLALTRLARKRTLKLANENAEIVGYVKFEKLNIDSNDKLVEKFVEKGFEEAVWETVKGVKAALFDADWNLVGELDTKSKLFLESLKAGDWTLALTPVDEIVFETPFVKVKERVYEKDGYKTVEVKRERKKVKYRKQVEVLIDSFKKLSAWLGETGQELVRDGRTGEYIHNPVTVGYMYMLKLHHLVEEKIHARATGNYAMITQQPLGGKAQMGGQRFGEMEVWALEAYGAAHALQEMLSIKSDDIDAREEVYRNIVKGNHYDVKTKMPESFKVLVLELASLALKVELLDEKEVRERFGRNSDGTFFIPQDLFSEESQEDKEAEATAAKRVKEIKG